MCKCSVSYHIGYGLKSVLEILEKLPLISRFTGDDKHILIIINLISAHTFLMGCLFHDVDIYIDFLKNICFDEKKITAVTSINSAHSVF